MSHELRILKVFPEDVHKLLKIGRQTFYDAFGPPHNTEENIQCYLNEKFTLKQITRELEHPDSEYFFAKLNQEIVGYLKLNTKEAQTETVRGNGLEIERIYIVREYQGKRIGQFLLDKSFQEAKDKKLDFIWLGVWSQNVEAIKFYNRNGFKVFDSHSFMLGSDEQTDLIMKLILE